LYGDFAKASIVNSMRDNNMAIRTPNESISTINKLKNHNAEKVKIPSNNFSTNTFHGITQFHMFRFHPTKKIIFAYINSSDKKHSKKFLPGHFTPLDKIK
jgi:hypothetical protein